MKNQYRIYARKSNANNIETHQTRIPRGSHKPSQINKNIDQTNDGTKGGATRFGTEDPAAQ